MDVNEHTPAPPSPWQPETNKIRLAVLGKMLEEAGELASAASRCVIQGIDELDPETGKPNRRWLEEEIADVWAMAALAVEHFKLDMEFMTVRTAAKMRHKREWYKLITED